MNIEDRLDKLINEYVHVEYVKHVDFPETHKEREAKARGDFKTAILELFKEKEKTDWSYKVMDNKQDAMLELFKYEQDGDCVSTCQEVAVLRKHIEALEDERQTHLQKISNWIQAGKEAKAEIKRLRDAVPEKQRDYDHNGVTFVEHLTEWEKGFNSCINEIKKRMGI